MARIIVSSYVVRFPLGGYLSWVLQWLVGLKRLGHEVYYVEKSGWPNSCYNPSNDLSSDDCSYGVATVSALLARFGLEECCCFVDAEGRWHGLAQQRVRKLFKSADLFVDMGMLEWLAEADRGALRVLVDGEPGFTQIKWEGGRAAGQKLPDYDYYYTVGRNIGTPRSTAPTAGKSWRSLFDPVCVDLFPCKPAGKDAAFTTVMSWQAHETVEFNGRSYGQKDVEFAKFIHLPSLTPVPLELAVGGAGSNEVPYEQLLQAGWRIRNSAEVTLSFDSFQEYIAGSRGEISVCKNVFVDTCCGCFSERSAAYLASGRPVVMQDTGFSAHLPCGRGLFAVRTADQAAAAIDEIERDYERHSRWAREVALEHLDTSKVLGNFLAELDL
ncbi:MAG: hypothetical protein HY315_02315 [Acidobacteria bacterium]|nr:hypothetical protein [Acidobacteriota bacterium]